MINSRFGGREDSRRRVHGVSAVDSLHLERDGHPNWREANVFLDEEEGGQRFDVIVTDPFLETLHHLKKKTAKFEMLLNLILF